MFWKCYITHGSETSCFLKILYQERNTKEIQFIWTTFKVFVTCLLPNGYFEGKSFKQVKPN